MVVVVDGRTCWEICTGSLSLLRTHTRHERRVFSSGGLGAEEQQCKTRDSQTRTQIAGMRGKQPENFGCGRLVLSFDCDLQLLIVIHFVQHRFATVFLQFVGLSRRDTQGGQREESGSNSYHT